MPNIAFEALEQFHQIDIAFRKHYFYLSYLEPDPKYLNPEKPKSKKEKMYQKEKEKASGDQENKAEEKMKSFARVPLEVSRVLSKYIASE